MVNVSSVGGHLEYSGNDVMMVQGARVIEADLMGTDGVVHVIDDVIFTELGIYEATT